MSTKEAWNNLSQKEFKYQDKFFSSEEGLVVLGQLFWLFERREWAANYFASIDTRRNYFDFCITRLMSFSLLRMSNTAEIVEYLIQRSHRLNQSIKPKPVSRRVILLENSANADFVIKTWSDFEYSINLICDFELDEKEKNEIQFKGGDEILKIIQKSDPQINQEDRDKIRKVASYSDFHTSPNLRKALKLLKRRKEALGEEKYQEFREFVNFFSALRNCMHSNFIYFGKNREPYTFGGKVWKFENGKPIQTEPLDPDPTIEVVTKLHYIYYEIIKGMDNTLIEDPTPEIP
ncbi:MAG: hypothetical protein RIF46_02050 [Cyclobacteriaceae bacterium]